MTYFIGHDLGTGGNKAVLVDRAGHILASSVARYALTHPQPGWAEQDPNDWWQAVTDCTRQLIADSRVDVNAIAGFCCSAQMLALVPMSRGGTPTHRAISWLDHRAEAQAHRMVRRLGGATIVRAVAGATPTGKDIVAKVAWLREHRPDIYRATDAFCDATGYLVARATGQLCIDHTGAAGTGMLDAKTRSWSRLLARLTGFPLDKMPPLRRSTDVVGPLSAQAAQECGLSPRTQVVMGMGDVPSAAVGSGAVDDGDAHICLGTSSWVGITVSRPRNAGRHGIVSLASADPTCCLLIGESETAGACVDWFARNIGVGDNDGTGAGDRSVYAQLDALAAAAPPGAQRLLFAPWMFGERAPVSDSAVRAAYINLSLEHHREDLIRAIYEGVSYNLRWILDVVARLGLPCPTLRVLGGGARSDVWLQILADVTGRRVDRVAAPQEAGAVGAALMAAVGLGILPELRAIKPCITIDASFTPRLQYRPIYDELYAAFRELYPALSRAGRRLSVPPLTPARPTDAGRSS